MLHASIEGLRLMLAWPAIGFMLLGTALGLAMGTVPGLGGIIGLVVLLPFTFGLAPAAALGMLLGLAAVVTTGDTVAAILLGVPGSAAGAATVIDGFPLAKRGEARRAFGAAYTVCALSGIIGALAMALSLPVALPLILSFGSPEFFLLGLLGLTMVGLVSGREITKGLAAGLTGLLLSLIGFPPGSQIPRYTFGQHFLFDGLPLVAVVTGLYAISQLIELAVRNATIAQVPEQKQTGMLQGVRDVFTHRWLMLRCSTIGIYIGMLPGLGALIAEWVAYGHAVHSTKPSADPRFGDGDIRGVIAPEAATHSVRGGELIPTVTLGIPASPSMALLLGALMIQGISPGREMLTTKLDVTFSLVWTLILANLIGALVMMVWSRQIARLAFVDGHLIVPGVVTFLFMGAWLFTPDLGSWGVLFVIGVLGFVMKHAGWPRPALILGVIVGPIMEKAYILSRQAFTPQALVERPVTVILSLVVVAAIVLAVRSARRARRLDSLRSFEGTGSDHALSLGLALVLVVAFAAAGITALPWPPLARLFPVVVSAVGVPILLGVLVQDALAFRRGVRADRSQYARSALFIASILVLIVGAFVVGQPAALTAFTLFYLAFWAKRKWWSAALYAAATIAFLLGFYGQVLNVPWLTPLL